MFVRKRLKKVNDLIAVVALQALVALLVRRVAVAVGATMRVRVLDRVGVRRRRIFERCRRQCGRCVAGVARPEHCRGRRWRRVLQERDRGGRRFEARDLRNAFVQFVAVADLLLRNKN